MGYRYAILGAGRQGVAAAYDIGRFGEADEVLLYDILPDAAKSAAAKLNSLLATRIFKGGLLDVRDKSKVRQAFTGIHAVVSAVPYVHNLLLSEAAVGCGANLCDLGGHTETVREQLQLNEAAQAAGVTLTPDCGMGPGLNISMGIYSMSFIENPQEVFIWDGGLPQNPRPPWNYELAFHINGLTNEYFGDAHFLRQGKVTLVPTLTEIETLEFPPPLGRLEAAVTSGGLSTAPWTFEGKLERLENKTLRYPGHWQQFLAFKQLGLFEEKKISLHETEISPREFFHALLQPQIQTDRVRDICVIRTRCNGKSDNKNHSCTLQLIERYDEATGFTAMEKLTGWHAGIVATLSAKGKTPKGAVPVESVLDGKTLVFEAKKRGWNFAMETNF